jgi:hypothetical protein
MRESLERRVWERAESCCEYCRIPQAFDPAPFQVDHIIARKHGGETEEGNLALACLHCNAFKGPNIAGRNPQDGAIVRLFHRRSDRWAEHFEWNRAILVAKTATGRVTINVLAINRDYRIALRESLLQEGVELGARANE